MQRKLSDANEVIKLRNMTLNPSFKGGIVTAIESDLYLKDYKFLDEVVSIMPIVIYFRKNSHLVQVFDRVLDIFESSGLIRYWTNLHMNFKLKRFSKKVTSRGPTAMNIRAMFGAFQIIAFGWTISLIFFFLELMKARLSFEFNRIYSRKILFKM